MENLFENFTISILKLNKLVQKIKQIEMREYELKAVHVMCLHYLAGSDGLTASELCRLTLEDKAAISRAVDALKCDGYVEYEPQKYNAVIRLTDEGRKVADYVAKKADAAVDAGGKGLTDADRAVLYGSLHTIAANLKEYYDRLVEGDQK